MPIFVEIIKYISMKGVKLLEYISLKRKTSNKLILYEKWKKADKIQYFTKYCYYFIYKYKLGDCKVNRLFTGTFFFFNLIFLSNTSFFFLKTAINNSKF